jgi:hypothetical protein
MSELVMRPFPSLLSPPMPACANPVVVVPERSAILPRWWAAILQLFAARAATASADIGDHRTPRFYPPRRCEYMEEAAMRREMFRL